MTYNRAHSRKAASSRTLRVFGPVVLCVIALLALPFCYRWLLGFWPPDLSGCTRMDIRYHPSTLDYVVPGFGRQSLFSRAEKTYLESLETFTTNDEERIKAFALDLSLGSYNGRARSEPGLRSAVYVTCYRNEKHLVSFYVFGRTVLTEHKRMFEYPIGLPNLEIIEPPRMWRFKLRYRCGCNMQRLHTAGPLDHKEVSSYPHTSEWCDAVMRDRINSYLSEERMRGHFKCPAAGEGKCHYAMNPNCKLDSPVDTVLLFETKAGWNQHGGPELFTFDNHDPSGGCVLLNDGTVKFIRTMEELQQLRWK